VAGPDRTQRGNQGWIVIGATSNPAPILVFVTPSTAPTMTRALITVDGAPAKNPCAPKSDQLTASRGAEWFGVPSVPCSATPDS